jgi:hypothetical protein
LNSAVAVAVVDSPGVVSSSKGSLPANREACTKKMPWSRNWMEIHFQKVMEKVGPGSWNFMHLGVVIAKS